MSNKDIEVYAEALRRKTIEEKVSSTQVSTQAREGVLKKSLDHPRKLSRDLSSEIPRQHPRERPTRDEIQEFSFRLRDTLKVKVQAEVPHEWQLELEEIARELNVKKLELYRFIYGDFLGKVRDKKET